jgi:tetratricopeptide (TPR) repeat protein
MIPVGQNQTPSGAANDSLIRISSQSAENPALPTTTQWGPRRLPVTMICQEELPRFFGPGNRFLPAPAGPFSAGPPSNLQSRSTTGQQGDNAPPFRALFNTAGDRNPQLNQPHPFAPVNAFQPLSQGALYLNEAKSYLRGNLFQPAIEACKRGLEVEQVPALRANLYSSMGFAYLQMGLLEEAKQTCREGLEIVQPDIAVKCDLYQFLAAAHVLTEQYQMAIQVCLEGLGLKQDYRDVHASLLHNLGRARYMTGQYDASIEACQSALALNSADPVLQAKLHRTLAASLVNLNRPADAILSCDSGLKIPHDNLTLKADLYQLMGDALSKSGRYQESIIACREGLKLIHPSPSILAKLFLTLVSSLTETDQFLFQNRAAHFQEIVDTCQVGLAYSQNDREIKAGFNYYKGNALNELLQYQLAIPCFQEALRLQHTGPETQAKLHVALAHAYAHSCAFESTIATCCEGLSQPNYSESTKANLYYLLAMAYLQKGLPCLAIVSCTRGFELLPPYDSSITKALLFYALANAYSAQHDPDNAFASVQLGLQLCSDPSRIGLRDQFTFLLNSLPQRQDSAMKQ